MKCDPPSYWIPGHCRNPPGEKKNKRSQLTKKEIEAIQKRMKELESVVQPTGRSSPRLKNRKLINAPHELIEGLYHDLRVSLFRLPWFIPGAVRRMLETKYRNKYPDPHTRYEVIKKVFFDTHNIPGMPDLYEYVVLKTCLAANDFRS